MNWTQPICEECWEERNPEREAARIAGEIRDWEMCAYCGATTRHGIYVRVNPTTVPYPTEETDE